MNNWTQTCFWSTQSTHRTELVVARANYLAADRPEVQYGAKEICRWMSSPIDLALKALKRLGRYIVGHRRLVFQYPWQTVDKIDAYSDTDWSGCPKTRKGRPVAA